MCQYVVISESDKFYVKGFVCFRYRKVVLIRCPEIELYKMTYIGISRGKSDFSSFDLF